MTDLKKIRSLLEVEKKRLFGELEQLNAEGRPSHDRRDGSPFGKREEEATESLELEKRLAMEKRIKISWAISILLSVSLIPVNTDFVRPAVNPSNLPG